MIRIDLGAGAWARVSPDVQLETVDALRRMIEAARNQFGDPITVHSDSGAVVTTDPRVARWLVEAP